MNTNINQIVEELNINQVMGYYDEILYNNESTLLSSLYMFCRCSSGYNSYFYETVYYERPGWYLCNREYYTTRDTHAFGAVCGQGIYGCCYYVGP